MKTVRDRKKKKKKKQRSIRSDTVINRAILDPVSHRDGDPNHADTE